MTFSHDIKLIGIFDHSGVERRERKLFVEVTFCDFSNMYTTVQIAFFGVLSIVRDQEVRQYLVARFLP
jgi:hypothetical protein